MSRHLKFGRFLSLAALTLNACFFGALTVQAQQTAASVSNAQLAAQVSEFRAQNHKRSLQYSWTSRTEVKIKGEQKVLKSEAVHYAPDGKLVKAPLGQTGDSKKTRGLRGRIKKKKTKQMRDWAGDLAKLLQKYNLPTSGNILDFVNAAEISAGPRPGTMQIRGVNVVQAGDTLTLIADSTTKALLETTVETQLDGDSVQMKTINKTLDSGLNYTAETAITVPEKEIEMNVQNFSYIKN